MVDYLSTYSHMHAQCAFCCDKGPDSIQKCRFASIENPIVLFCQCWKSHTVVRSFYLHNRNSFPDKTVALYGIIPQVLQLIYILKAYLTGTSHNDVIKWKHFPRYWPFVRGVHRSPVNSSHKGQWRRALMFSLICVWINSWINNLEAGDLRRYRTHYDVIVLCNCRLWRITRSIFGSHPCRNWPLND